MQHLHGCSAASGARRASEGAGVIEHLTLGQRVLYRGRAYIVQGVDPMSVPNARVYLADRDGGRTFPVPAASVELIQPADRRLG